MSLSEYVGMLVWTGAGAVLLIALMAIDSLFTGYKDMEEIKKGNAAVATRFIMKLLAQAYILSQSITTSYHLGEALIVSALSFAILLVLETLLRIGLRSVFGLHLDQGTKDGKMAHALMGGSFHITGALIIGACL